MTNNYDSFITEELKDRVYWESNSLVKSSPNINPDRIIPKSHTKDFPYDAVTVKIKNQKKGLTALYFKDRLKTRSYGSGSNKQSYTYCDSEAKIHLPTVSSWNGEAYNFQLQGTLPRDWDLLKVAQVSEWVRDEIEKMTGVEIEVPKSDWKALFKRFKNWLVGD